MEGSAGKRSISDWPARGSTVAIPAAVSHQLLHSGQGRSWHPALLPRLTCRGTNCCTELRMSTYPSRLSEVTLGGKLSSAAGRGSCGCCNPPPPAPGVRPRVRWPLDRCRLARAVRAARSATSSGEHGSSTTITGSKHVTLRLRSCAAAEGGRSWQACSTKAPSRTRDRCCIEVGEGGKVRGHAGAPCGCPSLA